MFCPNCGRELDEDARFCPYCGEMLVEDPAPAAPEPTAEVEPVPEPAAEPAPEPVPATPAVDPAPEPAAKAEPVPELAAEPAPAVDPVPAAEPTSAAEPAPALADTFAPASADGAAPAFAPAPAPESKKPRNTRLILGAAAAGVVLLVILAVAAVCVFFSSPKRQLERAFAKTAAAYAEAGESLGLPELGGLAQSRSVSKRFRFVVNRISDAEEYGIESLQGLGMRLDTNYDHQQQKISADLAAFRKDQDLLSIQLLVDGSDVYLSSPELTRGSAYGLNTETIGADLDRLGMEGGEVDLKQISFNLFDLVERVVPGEQQVREQQQAAAAAVQQLWDAAEVDKTGKTSLLVNGQTVNAAVYHLLIPQTALKDYLSAMLEIAQTLNDTTRVKDMMLGMGYDEAVVDRILSEAGLDDPYAETAEMLQDSVDKLGDLELTVSVSGGLVCAVQYSGEIDASKVKAELYLGGGSNYVDDLSLKVSVDETGFSLESTGDHAGTRGAFTDQTTIWAGVSKLVSELRYEPKASGNNLAWELREEGVLTVTVEGRLALSRDSVDLQLDDISAKIGASEQLSVGVAYYQGPCGEITASVSSPRMLAGMDEEELEALFEELSNNADEWAYSLMMSLYEPAGLL